MPPIQALPAETAKRLSSAQVAFSPDTVVKELVENALDAGASNVHVRVKDAGLALVSVKDDGTGIPVDDMPLVLQRYTTSKISSVEDLADVQTFGFRGEALNSIASLSQRTTICTRTEQEETGRIYEYDHHRRITSETTRAMQRGTQIDVEKLFHHLPVRKQLFSKESQQTCKRIKDLLIGFALLCPKTRIVLKFERSTNSSSSDESANGISKSSVSTTLEAVRTIYGNALARCLAPFYTEQLVSVEKIECESAEEAARLAAQSVRIEALLPRMDQRAASVAWRSHPDNVFIYINQRRVAISSDTTIRSLVAKIRQRLGHGLDEGSKYPFIWMHIRLPVELTDVNLEPDKTSIQVRIPEQLLSCIDTLLDDSFPLSQLPSLRIVSAGSQPQSQSSSSAHALARRVRVDPQSTLGQPQMSPPAVSQTGLKPDKAPPSQSGQPSNAGLEEHIQTPLLEAQDGRDANRAGNAEQPGEADSGDQLLDMLHSGSSAIDREAWSRGVAVSLVDQETGQAISLQASDVLVAPVECTVPRLGSNARSSDAATAVNSGALVRESSATSSRDARVPNASAHLQSHGQHHLASSDGDTDFAVTDKRSGRTSNNGNNGNNGNNSTGTSSITVPTAGAARQMPARGGIVSNFDSIMESLSTRIRPDERGGDADMDALPRRSRIQPQQADQGQASSSRQARKRKASGPDEAGNRRLDGFLAPAPHVASAKRRAMAIRTLLVDSQCANLPLNDLRGRYAALLAKRSADARKASQDRLSVQHDGFASVGVVAQPSHDLAGAACVVVCHRSALWLVNPQRVQETVLYHALTSGYAISSDPLPSPVPLTAAQVGGPHILQYLRSLPRDPANGAVKDNRLEANGFRLAFPDGGASLSSAPVLQGLATKIGSLDVADLRELLAGMYRHDQDLIQGSPAGSAAASDTSQGRGKASLSLFRPSKALRLFRDQARQLTRKRIEKNEANGSVVDDTVLACDRLLRHKQRQQRSADKPCSPAAVSSVEPIATLECTWQCPHGHAIAASLGPALRSTGPS